MDLVCLDTHILIWGIKQEAEQNQEFRIPQAIAFLHWLEEENIQVIIPAIVIAEMMARVPQDKLDEVSNLVNRRFPIAPFDTKAAFIFSKLWQSRTGHTPANCTRAALKADLMIISTAITRKASCIYSHDNGLKKIAEGHIEVKEMPVIPTQLKLLDPSAS